MEISHVFCERTWNPQRIFTVTPPLSFIDPVFSHRTLCTPLLFFSLYALPHSLQIMSRARSNRCAQSRSPTRRRRPQAICAAVTSVTIFVPVPNRLFVLGVFSLMCSHDPLITLKEWAPTHRTLGGWHQYPPESIISKEPGSASASA
jgi:hypothetical protein